MVVKLQGQKQYNYLTFFKILFKLLLLLQMTQSLKYFGTFIRVNSNFFASEMRHLFSIRGYSLENSTQESNYFNNLKSPHILRCLYSHELTVLYLSLLKRTTFY